MAVEIERKFLVTGDEWKQPGSGRTISQGYLCQDPDRSVRVRVMGEQAWLTIKGRSEGISRQEFEYPIPLADARQLLAICLPSMIEKTRYAVIFDERKWEVDEFHGENDGLVIAELEIDSPGDRIELPPWVGEEVSEDPRYYNAYLSRNPFGHWSEC